MAWLWLLVPVAWVIAAAALWQATRRLGDETEALARDVGALRSPRPPAGAGHEATRDDR